MIRRTPGRTRPTRAAPHERKHEGRARHCETSALRVLPAGVAHRSGGGPGRRSRGQGPGRRPEPGPVAVDAAGRAVAAGRHQRAARTWTRSPPTTAGVRDRGAGPARRRARLARRTPGAAAGADGAVARRARRRSATAAPRSARSCTPTRPRRCRSCSPCSAARSRSRARRAGAPSRPPSSTSARWSRRCTTTRSRSRRSSRPSPPGAGVAFDEIARRHGDYALVGAAALVDGDDGQGRLPVRGRRPDRGRPLRRAGRRARRGALEHLDPADDIHATADYRAQLVRVLDRSRGSIGAGGGSEALSEERHDVRADASTAPRTPCGVPARRLLSDALRHDLGLTGTHVGCEHGVCGACTVLVDGRPMRSCLMFAVSADGRRDHHGRGARPSPTARSARCSRRSSSATACSAASARPAS